MLDATKFEQATKVVVDIGLSALERQRTIVAEVKSDGSLVTETDRWVETELRQRLAEVTPGASFWGEEEGQTEVNPDGHWILDPIDGTSNYANGLPLWGVMAGFMAHGRVRSGIVSLPALGLELRTFEDRSDLPKLTTGPIDETHLVGYGDNLSSERSLERDFPGRLRHVGSFAVESAWVATGCLRASFTSSIRLYDIAAALPTLRAVGVQCIHLDGEELDESKWMRGDRIKPLALLPPGCPLPG